MLNPDITPQSKWDAVSDTKMQETAQKGMPKVPSEPTINAKGKISQTGAAKSVQSSKPLVSAPHPQSTDSSILRSFVNFAKKIIGRIRASLPPQFNASFKNAKKTPRKIQEPKEHIESVQQQDTLSTADRLQKIQDKTTVGQHLAHLEEREASLTPEERAIHDRFKDSKNPEKVTLTRAFSPVMVAKYPELFDLVDKNQKLGTGSYVTKDTSLMFAKPAMDVLTATKENFEEKLTVLVRTSLHESLSEHPINLGGAAITATASTDPHNYRRRVTKEIVELFNVTTEDPFSSDVEVSLKPEINLEEHMDNIKELVKMIMCGPTTISRDTGTVRVDWNSQTLTRFRMNSGLDLPK